MTEDISARHDKSSISHWLMYGALLIGLITTFIALFNNSDESSSSSDLNVYEPGGESGICQQVPKLSPTNKKAEQYVREAVHSKEYHQKIINKLSGIIQIPSESYKALGPIGEDDRWNIFFQIEDYLKASYPTVFENVKLDHANKHGLILTWEGSVPPSTAKPILMPSRRCTGAFGECQGLDSSALRWPLRW